jgi:hypothetical protein
LPLKVEALSEADSRTWVCAENLERKLQFGEYILIEVRLWDCDPGILILTVLAGLCPEPVADMPGAITGGSLTPVSWVWGWETGEGWDRFEQGWDGVG